MMPKTKKYTEIEGLDTLRDIFLGVTCPRCGESGILKPLRNYLVVRHYGVSPQTHLVPAEKVVDVLTQVEPELRRRKEGFEKLLNTLERLRRGGAADTNDRENPEG